MSRMPVIAPRPTRLGAWLLVLFGAVLAAPAVTLAAPYTGEQLYQLVAPSGYKSAGYGLPAQLAEGGQMTEQGVAADNSGHALLWNSSSTAIDLEPINLSGFTSSYALGVSGMQQVGYAAGPTTGTQAMMWNGSANTAIDLAPTDLTGLTYSEAIGTNGTQQVGVGGTSTGNHALLWNGTAGSAVDLDPAGFANSFAYGTDGVNQVGYAYGTASNNADHAILWSGTAASAIDLNPSSLGFVKSDAVDVSGNYEVGYAYQSNNFPQAILWSGSANSAVDLQSLLPAGVIQSYALTIDSQGNIFGVASYNGGSYAVEWSPVPEPSALVLIVLGGLGLALWGARRAAKVGTGA